MRQYDGAMAQCGGTTERWHNAAVRRSDGTVRRYDGAMAQCGGTRSDGTVRRYDGAMAQCGGTTERWHSAAVRRSDGTVRRYDGAMAQCGGTTERWHSAAVRRSDDTVRRYDGATRRGNDRLRGKIVSSQILICCSLSTLITHVIAHRQRISKTSRDRITYDRIIQASAPSLANAI